MEPSVCGSHSCFWCRRQYREPCRLLERVIYEQLVDVPINHQPTTELINWMRKFLDLLRNSTSNPTQNRAPKTCVRHEVKRLTWRRSSWMPQSSTSRSRTLPSYRDNPRVERNEPSSKARKGKTLPGHHKACVLSSSWTGPVRRLKRNGRFPHWNTKTEDFSKYYLVISIIFQLTLCHS